MKRTFVIDVDRCIGCRSCEIACKMENGVALGSYRCRVLTIGPTGEYPNTELHFLPLMCQQCENPYCLRVCPTGATYKRQEDGAVLIDQSICIGCGSCKNACPYGVLALNKELRVMDKCDQCQHLQEIGEQPACMKNCAGKAIYFRDLDEEEEKTSDPAVEEEDPKMHVLMDEGNRPTVRFVIRKNKWIDKLPE